jgi:hypothetical protein
MVKGTLYNYMVDEKNIPVTYAILVMSLAGSIFRSFGDDGEEEEVENHLNYTLH